jgi:cytochrome c oxidase assembly factor CtaG
MKWWCSASSVAWTWSWRPYPGVWLFILLVLYSVWQWNRVAARNAGRPAPPLHPLFVLGLLVLWVALDWPLGALGSGYLASAHMLQFLLIALAAPPMLLRGLSPDALAMLNRETRAARFFCRLTAPKPALILFNTAVLVTHLPPVVDTLMVSQLGSLLIDLLWIATGLVFWWPVVLSSPPHPKFVPPLKIGYLVLGMMFSPIMFGLVGFLAYSDHPLYGVFELAPPMSGLSSHDDHQLAGAMMSVGGATIAFIGISIIFFKWQKTDG